MTMISTNVSALKAQNASRMANTGLQTAMERLSTGKRINSAKDDAAGLSIASRMTSQIKGLAVASRNANDGISMAQTAEGALGEVTSMLQRMKELAVQSANGTLGTSERSALQSETNQLVSQINDISKTTNFNGLKLLDGTNKGLKLQTGTSAGDQVTISIAGASASDLGLTAGGEGTVVSGVVSAGTSVAVDTVKFNGVNAFAGTTAVSWTDSKGLAALYNANSARTGVTATASNNLTSAAQTGTIAAGQINGKAIGAATSADDLVGKINANSDTYGVTAAVDDAGKITLSNTTGAAITTSGGAFAGAGSLGYVSLQTGDGSNFTIAGTGLAASGLNASDGVSFTGGTVPAGTASTAISITNLKINGVTINTSYTTDATPTSAEAATGLAAAISTFSAKTGVTATASGDTITLASTNGSPVRLEGSDASKIGFNAQGGTDKMSYDLDISTQGAASAALGTIDKALDKVTAQRGDLGSVQNRLEVTVNNLSTASTNLEDSRSRIEDADFSAESTNLAKSQILSQAATAMLAQANQSQQGVLSLLR